MEADRSKRIASPGGDVAAKIKKVFGDVKVNIHAADGDELTATTTGPVVALDVHDDTTHDDLDTLATTLTNILTKITSLELMDRIVTAKITSLQSDVRQFKTELDNHGALPVYIFSGTGLRILSSAHLGTVIYSSARLPVDATIYSSAMLPTTIYSSAQIPTIIYSSAQINSLPIETAPTATSKFNPSVALTWVAGEITTIEKTVGVTTYTKTLTWVAGELTALSAWS